MNVIRSGLCALALWSALCVAAAAKDKTAAAPPPEPCNFLCGLKAYLSTDHMVASAPEPAPEQTQKPKVKAKKPVAAGRKATPAKTQTAAAPTEPPPTPPKAAPKPRIAVRTKPPVVQAAAELSPAPRQHRRNPQAAQQSAAWMPPPIPGSAPAITADFSPVR